MMESRFMDGREEGYGGVERSGTVMWKSMDDEVDEEVSCQEHERMLAPSVLGSRHRQILEVTRLPTMYCVEKCVHSD